MSPLIFFTFRIMVGLGFLMVGIGAASACPARAASGSTRRAGCSGSMVAMGPAGFVALLAGWTTTEAGRQPWTVYGLLRTADSVSPIGAPGVGASLVAFVVVYLIVFGAGLFFMLRLMARAAASGRDRAARAAAQRRHHAAGLQARCASTPAPAAAQHRWSQPMTLDLPLIWAGAARLRGAGLCRARRLRSRRRHPVRRSSTTRRPRRDGQFDRAGLGRQRDLAGARRRRAVGGRSRSPMRSILPALYLPIIVMLLALVFRGVAFEFRFRAATRRGRQLWDLAFFAGSTLAALLPGPGARRPAAGHPRREPRLCRRLVGLADRLHPALRHRGRRRLRAARRLLADLAHRGRAAGAQPPPRRARSARRRWR